MTAESAPGTAGAGIMAMRSLFPRGLVICAAQALFLTGASAQQADLSSYNTIAERNAFGLRMAPLPTQGPIQTDGSKGELRLTGYFCFGPKQWAYFVLEERGRPDQHYKLPLGEERSGIRLLAINPAGRTVEILEKGRHRVVTFESQERQITARRETARFVTEHLRAHERRQMMEKERELGNKPVTGL